MKSASLIFPFQLFKQHPALGGVSSVYLIEEWLYFHQYPFHKHKLLLHRASMQHYAGILRKNSYDVSYIPATDSLCDVRLLIDSLAADGVKSVQYADVVDDWLNRRITSACDKNDIKIIVSPTPYFLNQKSETDEYFDKRKRYFQTDFYIHQRKRRGILIDGSLKPAGGSWSYDSDNRKKIPKDQPLPLIEFPPDNPCVLEAKTYIDANFFNSPGATKDFNYATTHEDAEKWMNQFFAFRFEKFGDYEDAILRQESILFHSQLTPYLNTGLLTPEQVLTAALAAGAEYDIPLNSLEGFIRQIIGWREFMKAVYEREGAKQRSTNYWKFTRKLPGSFYDGTTGIGPFDDVIHKVLRTGYLHHIERLMIAGNFMLLCEIDPDDVYKWFMELFIDAYDWVMVPNVYAMSQFADGGVITTKPYISGSNYIIKMSDYKKGEWADIWDALFWRFMDKQRVFFSKNPRLGMLVRSFDKMPPEKRVGLITTAEKYLETLD